MVTFFLEHQVSVTLTHTGQCSLLGISPDLHVFIEELYDDDNAIAQHELDIAGKIINSIDENFGKQAIIPLVLPDGSFMPQPGNITQHLNYSGARLRGLREDERIQQLVRPLSIQSKMQIVDILNLTMPAPMILGIAESYVLSEACVAAPHDYIVCRRVRIAYALPEVQSDPQGQSYDYDSLTLQIAHPYDASSDEPLPPDDAFAGLQGVTLRYPTDCIFTSGYLVVSDGGGDANKNAVHVFKAQTA